ncbi:MAG TPA: tetratricopeptide repeat protein [Pyrinomonadaceae bacterium]|nr:tetratricopeptide repeat protein [Pyrinomonadaceae bacterium]
MSAREEFLGERYRVVEVCSGGMGEVFICEFTSEGADAADDRDDGEGGRKRFVALKTFKRQFFFDSATRLSFEREATTWLRLAGLPHIMPVIGIEQIDDRPFILMPAVGAGPGGERSIGDLLNHGPLDAETASAYALQLALALHTAADRIPGLVHGDLKPANVLLMGGDAYLADFGLAFAVASGRPDLRLESTWAYRAPEFWGEQPRPVSVAGDVYAFGATVFEMLTGRTPFAADAHDREAWAEAHTKVEPRAPAGFPEQGMPAALMELALDCLKKEPAARPGDFREVLDRLTKAYEEHDPFGHLMLLMRAAEMRHVFGEHEQGLLIERVRSLLLMNDPRQALEELEAVPSDQYTADLWMSRGTALSLLGRDEEALGCFEAAVDDGGLAPDNLVRCECEYALSLKRLGRFDEALKVYERLLPEVSDELMPNVVVNMATVYLQQQRGDDAVRVLEPFVRSRPEVVGAWANLGQAYVFVGRYDEAERAYGRALRLAPQEGRVRVMLGALYMDHMGRMEDAWAALDVAFDSGHESREWLTRMLACSLLLDRRETVNGLLYGLKNNFPEEQGKAMLDEALARAEELSKKYSGGAAEGDGEAATPADEEAAAPDESSEESAPEDFSGSDAGTAEPRAPSASGDGDAEEEHAPPGLPFINFRSYGFQDFTIDFYESPDVPDFLESFLREWRRATRDPRIQSMGSLRGSPFYFARCPGCGVHVLTNRDAGYRIRCRMCETVWQTEPLREASLDAVVARVSEVLGIQQAAEEIYGLFVNPSAETDLAAVREVCEAAGMVELPNDRFFSMYLFKDAMERGAAKPGDPWTVWLLSGAEGEAWAQGTTPRPVAAVVRTLQSRIRGVRTLSTSIPAAQKDAIEMSIHDLMRESEERLRQLVRSGQAGAADYRELAVVFDNQGRLAEAEHMARAAVAADETYAEGWGTLGKILFRLGDFEAAREALEQSVALDPTSAFDLRVLAVCYQKLGDDARAAEVFNRAVGLGGRDLQL